MVFAKLLFHSFQLFMGYSFNQPAIVEPRAFNSDGELRLLVDLVEHQIDDGRRLIRVTGEGKSIALQYLQSRFSDRTEIRYLDDKPVTGYANSEIIIFTHWTSLGSVVEFRLAKWNLDDCIDYVMARAPDQCKSVISRLVEADDLWLASQSPRVITAALEQLISNPNLRSTEAALQSHFDSFKLTQRLKNKILSVCIQNLHDNAASFLKLGHLTKRNSLDRELAKILSVQTVQYVLAIDFLISRIAANRVPKCLTRIWTPSLIEFVADHICDAQNDRAIAHLDRLANKLNNQYSSNAASILFQVDSKWKPTRNSHLGLEGAYLSGANWKNLSAEKSLISHADISNADLSHSKLESSIVSSSDFSDTNLEGAKLDRLTARRANFSRANLRNCQCRFAEFRSANLCDADLESGDFLLTSFMHADLTCANLNQANLQEAIFALAKMAGATLIGAGLTKANLANVDLRETDISAANFFSSLLTRTNFAGKKVHETDFDQADMQQSDWSNTRVISCSFVGSDLRGALMGDAHWIDCNLQNVDFTGCHFFYGSTRSGLVGSPYPSHGTRTGFYTDEFEDQYFKQVEEIRKASFCGCDFRGAKVEQADFYLVDLRGAMYDEEQKLHFQKCGAILRD